MERDGDRVIDTHWGGLIFLTVLVSLAAVARGGSLLYISDYYGANLKAVATDGTVSMLSGVFDPEGIAPDNNGNIYVASQLGTIDEITPSDGISLYSVKSFAALGHIVQGLAIDSQGNLYAALNVLGTVERITPTGNISTVATGLNRPQGLAFDNNGTLFCSDLDGIASISSLGAVTRFVSLSGGLPLGLAFDQSDNLYVAENSLNAVAKITPLGAVSTFGGPINDPFGVAFGSDGKLYVASTSDNAIYRITSTGSTSQFVSGLADQVTFIASVPEPSSLVVSLIGLLALTRQWPRRSIGRTYKNSVHSASIAARQRL